ncbi:RHOMBOID-like protein 1 isoform X3 [Dioscorea cayenensis subsp. rotundata]|uniref:RHOMBOID-like protein n=1 Tax=Dioscorea cayennensis subsp. rotundata TaxID=55577 RepID=A0AB40BQ95_DIOCR|nr:RHOMBOID-like protein 1 isoform X3 [Dioscorea cayenensis subsp. rotundata]
MEASNPAPPKLGYHLEINPTAPAAHHPKPQSSSSRDFQPFGRWIPWLVPSFVVANVVLFVITMYVNDCPENSPSCFAGFLGRFSFQPLKENPLIGPSSSALEKMGGLDVQKVVGEHQVRIGLLYVISGFGGSLMSSLFSQTTIGVGASGALFGLLGGMLSELIMNWTIYANKLAALLTLILVIAINLAVGILPHVDNFAHIGGFVSGFLLGFVILIRPQFGWVSKKHTPLGYPAGPVKRKHKIYQYILWIFAAILLTFGFTVALIMLFRGFNANDHCSWCHYLTCIPTSKWSCKPKVHYCTTIQSATQLNLTCQGNGKTQSYSLSNATEIQIQDLCRLLCT